MTQNEQTLASLPLTELRGVGTQLAGKLARLGLHSLQDLLFHLPHRYLDRTKITPINRLRMGQYAVIEAYVADSQVLFGKRRSLVVKLQSDQGRCQLRFFHYNQSQQKRLVKGAKLRCYGEAKPSVNGFTFFHPEYELVDDTSPKALSQQLTPIYHTTDGLSQQRMRSLSLQALGYLDKYPPIEWIKQSNDIAELSNTLRFLHQPPANTATDLLEQGGHPAQLRLALEELLAHHFSMRKLRSSVCQHPAPALPASKNFSQRFKDGLPYQLTNAQSRVCDEISRDLCLAHPMLRLVQGDVGAGKTVVAVIAALQAIEAGYQVAMMAPTELLAEQHLHTIQNWLEPLSINCVWLCGKMKQKQRKQSLDAIASGEAQFIIGTHAIFQAQVSFAKLGFVIIDEQHRFGVHQRLALREKGVDQKHVPHQLIMTATPIPRTLAMTAYGDLDCSVIDELPPGRKPIDTVALADSKRDQVVKRVGEYCKQGHQAYWVCTLIDESEALQCQAAEVTFLQMQSDLSGVNIGLVHGRMSPAEKSATMNDFKNGNLDLLIATTVIEVGVDVPNASLIVIENPERLGLSQLHQLRGRVGRGSEASHCVLVYHGPLSSATHSRLDVMRRSNDGFVIAEEDLRLRGPGEVLGTRQTGLLNFRIAQLPRDEHLLDRVKGLAGEFHEDSPAIPGLIDRWIGNSVEFGVV